MDRRTEIYKTLIDEFVEMSQSCVDSNRVRNGDVAWDKKQYTFKDYKELQKYSGSISFGNM